MLFCGSSIWNLNPTNSLHRKTYTLDKFWFQMLLSGFSRRKQFVIQWLCNHSIIHIILFNHSSIPFFIPTILKPQGHGAIFTCDYKKLFKKRICCCRTRRSFILIICIELLKKSNNCSYNAYISHTNALWILILLRHSWKSFIG